MDPATFVISALAGAVLKEVATDSYKAVKARLVGLFGLDAPMEALEKAPADEDVREFAAKQLAKSGALQDAEVLDAAEVITSELEKLPEDTPLFAALTVRDLKAESVEFRSNRVHQGGSILAERIDTPGKIVFEGNVVGDDGKR
jgi:hypothetical protein